MTCESVNLLLDELVAKELEAPVAARVEAHVASCERCAAEVAELERDRDLYSRYTRPVGLDPEASWNAVAARIGLEQAVGARATERVREPFEWARWLTLPRIAPIAVAACAVVIATVAFNTWQTAPPALPEPIDVASFEPKPETGPPPVDAGPTIEETAPPGGDVASDAGGRTTESPKPRRATPRTDRSRAAATSRSPRAAELPLPTSVATAEKQYLEAIAVLTRDVARGDARDSQLPAELVAPLREIDANIKLARAAVQTAPNDPIAVQSMLSAYDEKVDVLERIARNQVTTER